MRFSIVAITATLSATVLAQDSVLAGLPKCAQTCWGNKLGSCKGTDHACICKNTSTILSVSCCVLSSCSKADIDATRSYGVDLCKKANVAVNQQPTCSS